MTKKTIANPDHKQPGELTLRDGRRVADLSPLEKAEVVLRHADPSHPDYNPEGRTATGTASLARPELEGLVEKDNRVRAGFVIGRSKGLAKSKSRAQKRHELWERKAREIYREQPGKSFNDIAGSVFRHFALLPKKDGGSYSRRTVRDHLKTIRASLESR